MLFATFKAVTYFFYHITFCKPQQHFLHWRRRIGNNRAYVSCLLHFFICLQFTFSKALLNVINLLIKTKWKNFQKLKKYWLQLRQM